AKNTRQLAHRGNSWPTCSARLPWRTVRKDAVAAEFIRRLIRRAPPVSSEIAEAIGSLARLAEEKPALASTALFLRAALPGLFAEPIETGLPTLTSEQALAKLCEGVPLLRAEAVPLAVADFSRRWLHLCASLRRHQEDSGAVALARALRRGLLDPRRLLE